MSDRPEPEPAPEQDASSAGRAEDDRGRLESVLESLDDLVFLLDREGRFTDYHAPRESLLYAEPASFLGRTVDEVLPPDIAELVRRVLAEVAATGRAKPIDYRLDLGGEARWWSAMVSLRRGPGGEIAGFTVVSRDITRHKAVEDALRESEARLRAVLDLAPIGIAQTDVEAGRFLAVNRRLCAFTGYSEQELCARTIADITHPDDVAVGKATVAGPPWDAADTVLEKRYVRKDGRVVWGRVRRALLVDADGAAAHAVGVVEDITERRETEQRLRLQTSALDAAANGIVITDLQGNVQWVNAAFSQLTGYSEAEVLGGTLRVLKSGRHVPGFYRALWDTILAGRVWHGELVNKRKDGSLYDEDMTITPVRDASGAIAHFVAVKQDVSARRRSEQALRASEERYRTLVDNLDDVVFVTDGERRIELVNRAVAQFGYRPEDLVGRSVEELAHPDDAPTVRRLLDEARAGRVELRVLDAAGRPRSVRISYRPGEEGNPHSGVNGVVTDLTHLREVEEQMRAAQKLEAVGKLAGGIAHDFNNLLTVILSYAELAAESVREDDPLRADLQQILGASKRAENLTRQLLAFSRRQVMRPEPLDLGQLVDGIATMLGRLIGEDIALRISSAPGAHRVEADRGQLEQVLMNLAVNARDAMPTGGHLAISTTDVELDESSAATLGLAPGAYVELRVHDSGCGMDDATRARVFEPFFTTKEAGKGTGLGLSTVYGIVKQSGGGLSVQSAVGEGTTFRVYLPRLSSEHARAASVRPTPTGLPRGHETILVVEDETALREVARRVLSAVGYRVLVAANGGEALLISERRGADVELVVTDVVMPGMSGKELSERLRPLCPKAKVLFTSGYTDELIGRHGVLGPHFLPKPYDWQRLVQAVRAALDAER